MYVTSVLTHRTIRSGRLRHRDTQNYRHGFLRWCERDLGPIGRVAAVVHPVPLAPLPRRLLAGPVAHDHNHAARLDLAWICASSSVCETRSACQLPIRIVLQDRTSREQGRRVNVYAIIQHWKATSGREKLLTRFNQQEVYSSEYQIRGVLAYATSNRLLPSAVTSPGIL
jgi:hypothetical protein